VNRKKKKKSNGGDPGLTKQQRNRDKVKEKRPSLGRDKERENRPVKKKTKKKKNGMKKRFGGSVLTGGNWGLTEKNAH